MLAVFYIIIARSRCVVASPKSCKTLPYVLVAPKTSPGDVKSILPTQTVVEQPV